MKAYLVRFFVAVLFVIGINAHAASMVFGINANGAKEVTAGGEPNQGDPDGLAIGTLSLDNGTGSGNTGSATFNLSLSDIDLSNLTGHHVHQAPATTTGGIVLDFGDPDTILTGSLLSGTIENLPAATINDIFANPSGFYYNLHNGTYPAGAVRDQLTVVPEPSTIVLGILGGAFLGVTVFRRRQRA